MEGTGKEPATASANENSLFPNTRWSLIAAIQETDENCRFAAISEICENYWYPLYAYLRRQGSSAEDAQDITQGFFGTMLEKDYLADVDPEKGSMRTFMLTALKRFAFKQHRKSLTMKRGGGRTVLSIEKEIAESRFQNEPKVDDNPEKLYEREWALALMNSTFRHLEAEYRDAGKENIFQLLKGFLSGDEDRGHYRELTETLGMTEGALRVSVHRLRKRYRSILIKEISLTVDSAEAVDEELDHIKAIFGA